MNSERINLSALSDEQIIEFFDSTESDLDTNGEECDFDDDNIQIDLDCDGSDAEKQKRGISAAIELSTESTVAVIPEACENMPIDLKKAVGESKVLWRAQPMQLHVADMKFAGQTELPDQYRNLRTPFQYFSVFFGEDLFQLLTDQSNLYATQLDMQNATKFNVSVDEMRKFVGVLFMMSVVRMPNYKWYWGRHAVDTIKNAMTRNRYEQIRRFLHFADNTEIIPQNAPGYDPLHKVRPLITYFNEKFSAIPKSQRLCVDEQMCTTKMKTFLRQYIPNKPHKWGFKLFALCDSAGFVYNFELYSGAGDNTVPKGAPDLGAAANVVIRLSQGIPDWKNHIVYFDNFYTSLPLMLYLRSRGVYSLGTVRSNRVPNSKLSNEKLIAHEPRGYSEEFTTNLFGADVANVLWKDKKVVRFLSTYVGIRKFRTNNSNDQESAPPVLRWNKGTHNYDEVPCPQIIHEYNKHMGGVDLMDGLIGRYRIHSKSMKWTNIIAFHLFDLAMTNAYLLMRRVNNHTMYTLPDFRAEVAHVLLQFQIAPKKRVGRPRTSTRPKASIALPLLTELIPFNPPGPSTGKTYAPPAEVRYDQIAHIPDMLNRAGKRMCKYKGCTSDTQIFCTKCKLNLCLSATKKCFQLFHQQPKA